MELTPINKFSITTLIIIFFVHLSILGFGQSRPKSGSIYYSNGYASWTMKYNKRKKKFLPKSSIGSNGAILSKFIIEDDGIFHVTPQKSTKLYLSYTTYWKESNSFLYEDESSDMRLRIDERSGKIIIEWEYDKENDIYLRAIVYGISDKEIN